MLERMTISKRLWLMIATGLIAVIVISGLSLVAERRLVMAEREGAVKGAVEIVHTLVANYHRLVKSGAMKEDEAKKDVLDDIRKLRYGDNEYFWVNDMNNIMVMHGVKSELDGKDLSNLKDPNGKPLFTAMIDTVKQKGGGFVAYMWPKPGSDHPEPKVSYVKGFEPWGWIIGSGIYVDSVDDTVMHQAAITALFVGITALLLLVIGTAIRRSLLKQLGGEPAYAQEVTEQIANGDLSTPIRLAPDDRSSLLHAIAQMRNELATIVSKVRQGSADVASASHTLADGSRDLTARTESQASSLQETAASMEELTSTVKLNADSARQGTALAHQASEVAGKGGEVVQAVVDTMRGIDASSQKISEIIGVIDGIAFQTNILALNAAVEAARAGEQGRGFAVVAGEVRTLAQRSALAAKEIKELIQASASQVARGTSQVSEAGVTMAEVVHSIQRVNSIVGDISVASTEQSQGVSQVGEALAHIDNVTQQNAALVQEMSASAQSLQTLANDLVQAVSVFKVDQR